MPTREEALALLNGADTTPLTGRSREDVLAELNQPTGFTPPVPHTRSREQQQRMTRLGIIRERAAAGEPVNFEDLPLTTQQLAQRSTIRVGDQQVAAGQSAFADTPLLGRAAIIGGARLGALIENPILRLRGRGDLAEQNTRNVNALSEYSRRLAAEGPLGETAGGILHDVSESLTLGTLAAPFGGGGAGGAAATRQLAATSAAFGVDGADRIWNETEHLPHAQRMNAWYRQFAIDGLLTFAGGKIIQNMGLFHGRFFGQSIGKAAQQAAGRSGLDRVVGSALADSGVEGIQGALTYLNEAYTGIREFDWDEFKSAALTSAAVGGLAGAATSGVQAGVETTGKVVEFSRAVEKFRTEFPKAVEGARAANEFVANATPEQLQAAVEATTAKDFDAATGQKGKGPAHREAFEAELESLVALQAELEQRGVSVQKSLETETAALQERRVRVGEAEAEIARIEQDLRQVGETATALPEGFAKRRAEVRELQEQVKAEVKAIQEAQEALDVRRRTTDGEAAEYRAYLESEFDRIVAEERAAKKTPGSQPAERDNIDQLAGLEPPVRERTPQSFAEQYDEVNTSIASLARISEATRTGTLPDKATRKDIGQLIDAHVKGRKNRVALHNALATAKTPSATRKALTSLQKHLHRSEQRVAKQDFEDAVKKGRHLRTEFARQVDEVRAGVDKKSVDSLRDAAETIRDLTYQSATADTLLNSEREASITDAANQAEAEIAQARPFAMVADDPIRRAFSRVSPEDRITRGTADATFLREGPSRPEVQLARISPTLHKLAWNDLGVEAQAKLNDFTVEMNQGLDSVLDQLGISRSDDLSATMRNLATAGRGTAFNRWRREMGSVEGVPIKRADAWFLVLADMDPRNAAVFDQGGWVFPDGRQIPKFNERIRNQLFDFVGDEGLQLADWAFRYTNGPVIDRVNDASLRLTGRVVTEHKDVVPRTTVKSWDTVGLAEPGRLTDPTLFGYGHLRKREDTAGPLTWPEGTVDGFDYMFRHWGRLNRVAAFAVPARDFQAVLNHPNVEKAILAKDGKEGLENIREAFRVQVNGPKSAPGGARLRFRNGVAAAGTLAFRVPTLMIQGTGAVLSAAWNPRGIRNFVKAMPALWSHELQAEMRQMLSQHSGHYRLKFLRNEYATEQSGGIYQVADRFDPPTIAQQAMRPQRQIDHDVVAPLHYGQAKARVADQGITPDSPEFGPAVAREWERSMYRGETASHGMELPGFLRSGVENAAVGIWATFQSQGSRLFSLIPRAADLADRGQFKDAIAVGSVAMASALATSVIRAFMSFRDRGDETLPESVGKNVALEFAGSPPILGLFLQPLARAAMNMRTFDSAPLVVENTTDFVKAVGGVAGQIMQAGDEAMDKEKFFKNLQAATLPLAKFGGLPAAGLDDFRRRLERGAAAEDVWAGLAEFFPGLQQEEQDVSWEEVVNILAATEGVE